MGMGDAVEPLLERGFEADASFAGVCPLYLACLQRSLAAVRALTRRLTAVPVGPGETRPLHWACASGSSELVKLIYAECDKNVNALDAGARVPMFYALAANSFDEMARTILFLLSHGADVNADGRGKSRLLAAAVVIPGMPVRVAQLLAERVDERELAEARELALMARNPELVGVIDASLAGRRARQGE
jgi:ankyrin repeat protein